MKNKLLLLLLLHFIFPNMIKPANGSNLNYTHVLFEWNQIPDAIYYIIQLDSDITFIDPILEIEGSSTIYILEDPLNWNTTYYWRVKPKLKDTNIGIWLETNSFSTSESIYSINVDLISEDNMQTGVTMFSSLSPWRSAGFDHYGNEIWNTGQLDFLTTQINNQHIIGFFENQEAALINFNLDTLWYLDKSLNPHEIIQLPNGNYLGLDYNTVEFGPIPIGNWTEFFQSMGYAADGITNEFIWVGSDLIEWDENSKSELWRWNPFDHYSKGIYDSYGHTWEDAMLKGKYAWLHTNALYFDDSENALYVSHRNISNKH